MARYASGARFSGALLGQTTFFNIAVSKTVSDPTSYKANDQLCILLLGFSPLCHRAVRKPACAMFAQELQGKCANDFQLAVKLAPGFLGGQRLEKIR
jgi:hypothetical protein